MATKLADNTDEVLKVLTKHGITRTLAKEASEIACRVASRSSPWSTP